MNIKLYNDKQLYQKTKSLCLVVTWLVTYKIYTTYQSTYFIDDFIQGVIKNPKIKLIHYVHQKICTEQVSTLEITCCYVDNLKLLGFTGEPVT